jgi:predicted permease
LLLVSGAAVFVLHLSNLRNSDLGFERRSVLLVSLDPEPGQRERLFQPYEELLTRLNAIPAVRAATLAAPSPFSGGAASRFVEVEGFEEESGDRRRVLLAWVAPRYFETLGTPLIAGQDFRFTDRGRPPTAIVSDSVARYYFGERNPLGQRFRLEDGDELYDIIGVSSDAKYMDLHQPAPRTIYLNAFQEDTMFANTIALRTDLAPAAVSDLVHGAVQEVVPHVSVGTVTTLADQVDRSIVPERLIATLSTTFGALGTVMAAIGLYGLLAYTVARRTNEIGIRMALGARRRDVVRTVLSETIALLTAGLALGVPLAVWSRRFASSLIGDQSVASTLPILLAAVTMIAISLVAAAVPAHRAARVDPMSALRQE